jgi:hypothetical protein
MTSWAFIPRPGCEDLAGAVSFREEEQPFSACGEEETGRTENVRFRNTLQPPAERIRLLTSFQNHYISWSGGAPQSVSEGVSRSVRLDFMHLLGYGLPRSRLLGSWVNRGNPSPKL